MLCCLTIVDGDLGCVNIFANILMLTFLQAMRYPLNAHRKELAAAEGAREREKELAKEIQEGDLDDDEGLGDF